MPIVQDLCQRTVIINAGQVVVDDAVSNLLRLFETRAYEVRLGTALSQTQIYSLERTFPVVSIADQAKMFKVNLKQDEDIYLLMDILRSEHSPVESIDLTTINFEQVFRQLIHNRPQEVAHVLH